MSAKDGQAIDRRTGKIRRQTDREVCQFHYLMCDANTEMKGRLKDGEKEHKIFFTKGEAEKMWLEVGKKADWKVIVLFVAIMVGSLGVVWTRLEKNSNMLTDIMSKQNLLIHQIDTNLKK